MSDRILVAAIGAVIEIDVEGRRSGFAGRVREAWTDALTAADGEASAVVAVRPELDDDAALAMLSTDVTLAALEKRRGDPLWMLHAAGLADAEGRVVVLSAASGTGKTTAARHLSRRFAYVSDETVGVADDGSVVAYRKPLSVIEPSSPHKVQVAPSRLHEGPPLAAGLRVAAIVVIDRREDGPDVPEVERLDIATALELLAPQTSYLSDMPAPLHLVRDLLAAVGGAVRIRYREAASLDGAIDDLLRSASRRPVADATGRAPLDPTELTGSGVYGRTVVIDALDLEDGRLALLRRSETGSRVHVLDGIGPTVWHAASGLTVDEITDQVVAAHGRPGDADPRALVQAAIDRLHADGLLRASDVQTGA
ncbi:ATP-binding protein [Microbacterium sufflavum]|uniref:ATP-binding protein n=1 Tax=Microbacterium sufflavum TaxID=2851649 RepID=A0ABY4IG93_9MICO|nr:ATP-binding protein [Microbacterium sufflavum]UPL11305.1 ATP-binding protein [Microbacterium sufflavum]